MSDTKDEEQSVDKINDKLFQQRSLEEYIYTSDDLADDRRIAELDSSYPEKTVKHPIFDHADNKNKLILPMQHGYAAHKIDDRDNEIIKNEILDNETEIINYKGKLTRFKKIDPRDTDESHSTNNKRLFDMNKGYFHENMDKNIKEVENKFVRADRTADKNARTRDTVTRTTQSARESVYLNKNDSQKKNFQDFKRLDFLKGYHLMTPHSIHTLPEPLQYTETLDPYNHTANASYTKEEKVESAVTISADMTKNISSEKNRTPTLDKPVDFKHKYFHLKHEGNVIAANFAKNILITHQERVETINHTKDETFGFMAHRPKHVLKNEEFIHPAFKLQEEKNKTNVISQPKITQGDIFRETIPIQVDNDNMKNVDRIIQQNNSLNKSTSILKPDFQNDKSQMHKNTHIKENRTMINLQPKNNPVNSKQLRDETNYNNRYLINNKYHNHNTRKYGEQTLGQFDDIDINRIL